MEPKYPALRTLPADAHATQLVCELADGSGEDLARFPGDCEHLEASWSHVTWEISGVRAFGRLFLTTFRLICDAECPRDEPLDVGLADVRSMHLEVPAGFVDQVELLTRSAHVRQWLPHNTAFTDARVDEVLLSCLDLRWIRLMGLREVWDETGGSSYLHCPATTRAIHRAIREWALSARAAAAAAVSNTTTAIHSPINSTVFSPTGAIMLGGGGAVSPCFPEEEGESIDGPGDDAAAADRLSLVFGEAPAGGPASAQAPAEVQAALTAPAAGSRGRRSLRHFWSPQQEHHRRLAPTSRAATVAYPPSVESSDCQDQSDGGLQHCCSSPGLGGARRSAPSRNPGEAFVAAMGRRTAGWDIGEDAEREFFDLQRAPRSRWRLTRANTEYLMCETYPRQLVVPAEAPDELVWRASSARARKRLPVLTYFHAGRGSALLRCSQPSMSGGSDGQHADQEYLELCRQAVHPHAALSIFDCRSQVAAHMNVFTGGGQEDPRHYGASTRRRGSLSRATINSLDVGNIHEMLSSFNALRFLVSRSDVPESKWLQRLGDTGWLDHCRRITEASVTIARRLATGSAQAPQCIVIHCSDGWDRTTQICALAQVLADARFRTRHGFATLIEKEWRRFGHRFAERSVASGKKASPIFVQWLFCVAAVVDQFPREFEFTSADLMLLADLRVCGWIGTFLFNCERDARDECAQEHQVSAWSLWLHPQKSMRRPSAGGILPACGVFTNSECGDQDSTPSATAAPNDSPDSPATDPHASGTSAAFGAFAVCESPGGPGGGGNSVGGTSPFMGCCRGSREEMLLLPVTSLKRFRLWEWALRYDEVAFSRRKAYSKGADSANSQRLGRRLVTYLRDAGSAECKGCKGDFGLARRRHHCRGCGLLFCSACVQWRIRLVQVHPGPALLDANVWASSPGVRARSCSGASAAPGAATGAGDASSRDLVSPMSPAAAYTFGPPPTGPSLGDLSIFSSASSTNAAGPLEKVCRRCLELAVRL